MGRKRVYRLDHITTITDDGYTLVAEHKPSESYSSSIGIQRPLTGEIPQLLTIVLSKSGEFFYLKDYCYLSNGAWLGFRMWDSYDALKAHVAEQSRGQITTPNCLQITKPDGSCYWREHLPFHMYDVKAAKDTQVLDKDSEQAKDALAMYKSDMARQAARFNEVITHTGRTLDWIMSKLGAWVPFEEEPVIELTD